MGKSHFIVELLTETEIISSKQMYPLLHLIRVSSFNRKLFHLIPISSFITWKRISFTTAIKSAHIIFVPLRCSTTSPIILLSLEKITSLILSSKFPTQFSLNLFSEYTKRYVKDPSCFDRNAVFPSAFRLGSNLYHYLNFS